MINSAIYDDWIACPKELIEHIIIPMMYAEVEFDKQDSETKYYEMYKAFPPAPMFAKELTVTEENCTFDVVTYTHIQLGSKTFTIDSARVNSFEPVQVGPSTYLFATYWMREQVYGICGISLYLADFESGTYCENNILFSGPLSEVFVYVSSNEIKIKRNEKTLGTLCTFRHRSEW